MLVSWVALVVAGGTFHTENTGFDVASWPGGVVRVSFGFTLGTVIYRCLPSIPIPAFPVRRCHAVWGLAARHDLPVRAERARAALV